MREECGVTWKSTLSGLVSNHIRLCGVYIPYPGFDNEQSLLAAWHIDFFADCSIKQCIVDVELRHFPATRQSYSKHHTYICWFDNRTERLIEIENPFATSCAFSLLRLPSEFSFTLKTHLYPIGLLSCWRSTNDHVPFWMSASNSHCIAWF